MSDNNKEHKADPVMKGLSTALVSLSELLRYATEENFMDGYDAACSAARGIRAISDALEHMNL